MNSRRMPTSLARLVSSAILMIAVFSGCQALTTQQQPITSSPDMITVQIRQSNRKPKNTQIPLKPDMRLQEIVDSSKAPFRHKKAYIVRTSPKTGQQHKLEASFDTNRRVSMETDYAIQPGDRVVIAEDTTSSFDRVMKTMIGRN